MRVRSAVAAMLLLACACPKGAAQSGNELDLPRAKVFGLVRDGSGKPWIGAEVHLLSRPLPQDERVGEADHLAVRSDRNGRFRAMIIKGRPYSAWAWSPIVKDEYRRSAVVEEVFPSMPVILFEQAPSIHVQHLKLTGLQAWSKLEPLRFSCVSKTRNVFVEAAQPREQGLYLVPRMPGNGYWLEVSGKHDVLLYEWALNQNSPAQVTLRVLQPHKTGIAIRSILNEKGIAGARIYRQLRGRLREVARTEADGFVFVDLPANRTAQMLADAPGFGIGALRAGVERRRNRGKWPLLRAGAKVSYYSHLGKGTTIVGRVLLPSGAPARRLALQVHSYGMHYEEKNRRSSSTFTRIAETDVEGKFSIPGILAEYPVEVRGIMGKQSMLGLPRTWQEGMSPILPLLFSSMGFRAKELTVSLSDFCPVDFEIQNSDGSPAQHASFFFTTGTRFMVSPVQKTMLPADHGGRARFLLPSRDDLTLVVRSEQQWTMKHLVVRRAKSDPNPAAVTVKIEKMLRIKGKAVDGKGKPVESVMIYCNPQIMGGIMPGGSDMDPGDLPAVSGRNRAVLLPIQGVRELTMIMQRLGLFGRTQTGADGRFEITVPAAPMTYRLYVRFGRMQQNLMVQVEDQSIEDLEIEVTR